MKTILGLVVAPLASREALPQTPDRSSTAKATVTDNKTVLLMSNTLSWRGGREKGDQTPAPDYSYESSIASMWAKTHPHRA
jgi:hypothetical protein